MEKSDSRVQKVILLRVLVADSDRSVNERLSALLSEIDGISVFDCAQESSKVVGFIENVRPDILILDLETSGPVGMKTLAQIKKVPGAPIVIVLSDHDEAPLRQAALNAGAEHYLVKTDIERLQGVLKSLLQQSTERGLPTSPSFQP
jgi:DNA-binding NarL/FixJ family response regulator